MTQDVYVPFVTIGYWTQFTVVRGIAERAHRDPSPWIPTWQLVLFDDASASWTGSLVVFGYLVWGIAAGSAAVGLFAADGALAIITATALAITAALSILGGIGFVARNPVLVRGVFGSASLRWWPPVWSPSCSSRRRIGKSAARGVVDGTVSTTWRPSASSWHGSSSPRWW